MMDPEIKAKWIKKLRSGQYEQGRGRLVNDDKHCCLGVLCNVLPNTKFVVDEADNLAVRAGRSYVSMSALLPPDVCGIPLDKQHQLASLNDGTDGVGVPKSFNEIADWIEANL